MSHSRAPRKTHLVGIRLRDIRKAKRLTQTELASLLHVAQRTVSDWERGKTQIDADFLPRIADALGVDVCAFYREPGTEESVSRAVLDRELARLEREIAELRARVAGRAQPSAQPRESVRPAPPARKELRLIARDLTPGKPLTEEEYRQLLVALEEADRRLEERRRGRERKPE